MSEADGIHTPRPDQRWKRMPGEPANDPNFYDPQALREGRGLVVVEDTAEDIRAREIEAQQTETEIEGKLRDNAQSALDVQAELIERAREVKSEDVPTALRAVSDVSSKNIDGLFKVTGRDRPQSEAVVDMLSAMAAKGYLKMNVEIGPPADPPADEPDP